MSKEAMKLALEALEKCRDGFEFTRQYVGREVLPAIEGWSWYDGDVAAVNAITALQKALANEALDKMAENAKELGLDYEPAQQEPVAWIYSHGKAKVVSVNYVPGVRATPLYTSPPAQRTWVGLSDEEITDMWAESSPYYHEDDFARAIEAKLKEKNNG